MIDELFLYSKDDGLFKSILNESTTFQGRYHVSPNYGHDLNANNLDSYLKDPAYGVMAPVQKYPICVCITPTSRIFPVNGNDWEEFYFALYFLQRTYVDGKNQVKQPDKDTGRSTRRVEEDWKQMKEKALEFRGVLKQSLKQTVVFDSTQVVLPQIIRCDDEVRVSRVTKYNNDNLSGVGIVFKISMYVGLCDLIDYSAQILDNLQIRWPDSGPAPGSLVPYVVVLGDTMDITITEDIHMQTFVRDAIILDPSRVKSDASIELKSDNSVRVRANVSLLNYTLIIY